MKILMLVEYFTPYDLGGSEWSTYYLSKGLSERGLKIIVLTPNYGKAPRKESLDGFEIIRFPFYKKMTHKQELSPFWQNNSLWILWTIFFTIKYCISEKIDVVHVQGKYFLPAAVAAKFLLGKKVAITLRDYILLCPLGICLLRGQKTCSLLTYFLKDLKDYIKIYLAKKDIWSIALQIITASRARLVSLLYKHLLNYVDAKVTTSRLEKDIYQKSTVKSIEVIANPANFQHGQKLERSKNVIFAGRLTPGKGPDILLQAIPRVLKKHPNATFYFFGEGFLKKQLVARAKYLKISDRVRFAGRIGHAKLLRSLGSAYVSVIPSIWPEPFGRVAVESLAAGTPVVVTRQAGVAEFIENGRWGVIKKSTPQAMAVGIIHILNNHQEFRRNLIIDNNLIKSRFSDEIYDAYLKLYQRIAK